MRKRPESTHVRTSGARRFGEFLARYDIKLVEAARALHVSSPTILAWRDGMKLPTPKNRERIEVWTHGEVQSSHWGVARDTVKVRPFVRLSG